MIGRSVVLALGLLGLLPAAVVAQGLGDTAAQERARREKETQAREAPPPPVYTDRDLAVYRPADSDSSSDSEGDDESAESGAASGDGESPRARVSSPPPDRAGSSRPQLDEVYRARERVGVIEAQINQLSGRLNPMSRDYIYGQNQSVDAANQELQVRAEIEQLQQELARARQELAEANEALNAAGRRGRMPESEEEE